MVVAQFEAGKAEEAMEHMDHSTMEHSMEHEHMDNEIMDMDMDMGMMDGFHWSLSLMLWTKQWTSKSKLGFLLNISILLVLCFLHELVAKLRVWLSARGNASPHAYQSLASCDLELQSPEKKG